MYEFRMPSLGADMEAGRLVDWLVKPGDQVKRGQVVAVVETQKGAVDVEIWESGIVDKLVVETGSKVPVGEILAFVRTPDESVAKTAQTLGKPEILRVEATSMMSAWDAPVWAPLAGPRAARLEGYPW